MDSRFPSQGHSLRQVQATRWARRLQAGPIVSGGLSAESRRSRIGGTPPKMDKDPEDGENARDLSKRRRRVGRAKSPISWIFASADAVESSGGQRSQSVLGAFIFSQRRVILILGGDCARGSPTVARGASGNRSGCSGHHRVSTGANLDAPGIGKPIGPVEFSPATGRHRVVRPTGDRTDPSEGGAELVSSLGDR
jgi:hypothetical protein